jgi:ATP-binding cassette, subfamily F, member 3
LLIVILAALLKAVADGLIPGIPWSLRVLLLGQTRSEAVEDGIERLDVKEETVLEHVVRSNKLRERYLKEANSEW